MSAQVRSRDFAQGRINKLRRMKKPIAIVLTVTAPRNPMAWAMAQRRASGAAGQHIRSRGAQRRADKVALAKALPRCMKESE